MTLKRRPCAVVFDLDGTLIDSEALVREAYLEACRAFGVAMSDEQFLMMVGKPLEASDALIVQFYGPAFPLERFTEARRAYIGERVAPLKPGARELMDALDAMGAPFGLATSSRRPWVDRHFAAHNLADRFRAVVTRQDCVNGKPDPEPYVRASAALGFSPDLVLALEDSHTGVRSAHAAGCMTIMVPDLLPANSEMHDKAHVFDTLHEVRGLLRMFD